MPMMLQFGVIGSGEKQAALLMATFGPLTAKNIQSAMWRHAFTSHEIGVGRAGRDEITCAACGTVSRFSTRGINGHSMATS